MRHPRWFRTLLIFYGRIPLRRRLMLTFGVLIILPLAVFATVTLSLVNDIITREVLLGAQHQLEQNARLLNDRLDDMASVAQNLAVSTEIRNTLNRMRDGQRYSLEQQVLDFRAMDKLIADQTNAYRLWRIRIYAYGEAIYSAQQVNHFPLSAIMDEPWYEMLRKNQPVVLAQSFVYVYDTPMDVITLMKPVIATADFTEPSAVIAVDIPLEQVSLLLAGTMNERQGAVALVDAQGKVWAFEGDEAFLPRMHERTFHPGEWQRLSSGVMALTQPLEGGPFALRVLLERSELFSPLHRTMGLIGVMLLGLIMLSYLLMRLSTALNVDRIKYLARRMQLVRGGDLSVRADEISGDEIGILEKTFNYLMESIQQLLEKTRRDEAALRNTEIRLLQTQIQPHFLYNTLDMISWRAREAADVRTAEIVAALAGFYRIGLSRGRESIPLPSEAEHVRLYVWIQNQRFDDKIRLHMDIPPQLSHVQVPGNLLQPLAENAILHGLLESERGGGTLCISAREREGTLILRVEDDGVGIPEPLLSEILRPSDGRYFGVWNVSERIRLCYGEGYGLTYAPRPGGGTIATITLPIHPQSA